MTANQEILVGADGDVFFVPRGPTTETEMEAREYALSQGYSLSSSAYEAEAVEMLPVPEHFIEVDDDWAVVRPGTPGAVAYWRFTA